MAALYPDVSCCSSGCPTSSYSSSCDDRGPKAPSSATAMPPGPPPGVSRSTTAPSPGCLPVVSSTQDDPSSASFSVSGRKRQKTLTWSPDIVCARATAPFLRTSHFRLPKTNKNLLQVWIGGGGGKRALESGRAGVSGCSVPVGRAWYICVLHFVDPRPLIHIRSLSTSAQHSPIRARFVPKCPCC